MTLEKQERNWPHYWDPEDEGFWQREGKKIANRNLSISIPNLLLGFAVWIYWGMVAKYIQQLHFGSGGEPGDRQPLAVAASETPTEDLQDTAPPSAVDSVPVVHAVAVEPR